MGSPYVYVRYGHMGMGSPYVYVRCKARRKGHTIRAAFLVPKPTNEPQCLSAEENEKD
jgi:hypothetical protein